MFVREFTQTGVNNFSGEQMDFTEDQNINATGTPPNTIAVIRGYSYNSLGTAHDAVLELSPLSGSADNSKIELENLTGINSFVVSGCEIPVPRINGTGDSFVVLFTTSGAKDNSGTLRITYTIEHV